MKEEEEVLQQLLNKRIALDKAELDEIDRMWTKENNLAARIKAKSRAKRRTIAEHHDLCTEVVYTQE